MTTSRIESAQSMMQRWLRGILVLCTPLGVAACTSTIDPPSDAMAIGLLLPYTGDDSGTSANFERAAIFATNRVNEAGGIRGKPVRMVAADTHSSVSRSSDAVDRLIAKGVSVVLGAENADIAEAIEPIFAQREVTFVSPLVGAADDSLVDCEARWFRLAPSARALGEALAKRMASDRIPSVVVLWESDAYNRAFASSVSARFESLQGRVVLQQDLGSAAQSYRTVVGQVLATGVSNIVLATSPRTAALLVNEFSTATRTPIAWYLSPLLKTDLLVRNVAPSALEGARGVAPKIYAETAEFQRAFEDRWEGDQPLEGAYFYYDAVALVAYALELADAGDSGVSTSAAFKQAVMDVAITRGQATGWDELERGLRTLRAGERTYYSGLTGPMVLNSCGARQIGTSGSWTVKAGQIVNDDRQD